MKDDPCWKGYEMIGMKMKDGRKVPNCVPVKTGQGKSLVNNTKEKWIQEVVDSPKFKRGAFTAQAKEHDKTTKEFMKEVLEHPDKYSTTTRRRAQFMKNIQ